MENTFDGKLKLIEKGNNKYIVVECINGSYLELLIKKKICRISSKYQEIALLDTLEFGMCLFLNGVIQSCAKYHEIYDKEILRYINKSTQNLLILGGGDGNVLNMALKINPQLKTTVVEIDNEMINVSDKYIYNSLFNNENVNIIINDAFVFLESIQPSKYDQIVVDLTDQPIGLNSEELIDYYMRVIKLSFSISAKDSYVSAYVGCDERIAIEISSRLEYKNEIKVIEIPSFGESCYILHISNITLNQ